MNHGLSNSLPLLVSLQSLGLGAVLAVYFIAAEAKVRSLAGALAILGAGLTAFSPLLHSAAILTLGPGLPTPYAGLVFYGLGICGFMTAVVVTRRRATAFSLPPFVAVATWTFFLLRVLATGF